MDDQLIGMHNSLCLNIQTSVIVAVVVLRFYNSCCSLAWLHSPRSAQKCIELNIEDMFLEHIKIESTSYTCSIRDVESMLSAGTDAHIY